MATVSDFLIERLLAWGVRRIYGFPGDGINGIVTAIERHKDAIDFVQVRHEEQAAFMACAHAKFTGELGVCLATSGPGAVHLLNGLYDAKQDHVPVLALTGQSATTVIGSEFQQELDLQSLFKDVASEYLCTVMSAAAARHAIDRAVRGALGARTVTALIWPKDIQEEDAVEHPPHKMNFNHSGVGLTLARMIPPEDDLRRAAELLNAGSKVAILAGAGAFGAEDELRQVADALKACCAKALLGKAVLPDDLPWVTGTLGLLGTEASSAMMRECDTLLMVGTNYPYAQFLPKEGQARAVQIDTTTTRIGIRYPVEVNLQGSSRDTLAALFPLLRTKADDSWRERIAKVREHAERVSAKRAQIDGIEGIYPEVVFVELNKRLPDNVILTADAGTSTNWSARHLAMRSGMKWSLSGGLATMGSAVPYAIAAKFAFPDRPAIAITGDGAMQMNGMNELITVARYWKRWSDPRLIFLVANNRDLNQVTWEMRIESGSPDFPGSQHLPDVSMAAFARLLGFEGIKVEQAGDVGPAIERALSAAGPVVLEMVTDPTVSMLPPHVTVAEARSFTKAMLKGDPEEGPVLVQSVKGVLAGIFPAKENADR
ncbi:MAG: thiamine pyrophosphate-requiring protein [Candidatus Eremiobacteraeota bacterium]|nr:thiamine pyrophosphate-requiring protein [Candidatus Eremiobacteraeota bacterium]